MAVMTLPGLSLSAQLVFPSQSWHPSIMTGLLTFCSRLVTQVHGGSKGGGLSPMSWNTYGSSDKQTCTSFHPSSYNLHIFGSRPPGKSWLRPSESLDSVFLSREFHSHAIHVAPPTPPTNWLSPAADRPCRHHTRLTTLLPLCHRFIFPFHFPHLFPSNILFLYQIHLVTPLLFPSSFHSPLKLLKLITPFPPIIVLHSYIPTKFSLSSNY